uniref:Conserved oligomeric Golgi complex subunit 4 n=1 Tax=Eutreptiella gymnastica TaxID=73025 RepID=A0A7S4LE23_9EUGL
MTGPASESQAKAKAQRRHRYEELLAKISQCEAEKLRKWKEIHALVSNKAEMQAQEEFLGDLRRHQLSSAKDRTVQLAGTISEAAKLANKSSKRVKELDQVKARVNEALELVEGITSQHSSLEGVTEALASKDYETAVKHVTRYFETEKQLKNVGEMEDLTSSATSTQVQLEADKLREAIRTEFKDASSKKDSDRVIRFSKLFAPLDMATEGLELYLQFLKEEIATELTGWVKENVKKVETKDGDGTYLAILSRVLDTIAATLEDQDSHVATHFGTAGTKEFLHQLNNEASSQMMPILKSIVKTTKPLNDNPQGVEPVEMDEMMDEIAHVSRTCNIYYHFIASRHAKAEEAEVAAKDEGHGAHEPDSHSHQPTPAKKPQRKPRQVLPKFLIQAEAYEYLQTVLSLYIPLQRDYLNLAFSRAASLDSGKKKENKDADKSGALKKTLSAIKMNTQEEDDMGSAQGQGTSLIEDVFYMLRISCHRVVQCNNSSIISAVLNIIADLLRDSFLTEIQKNIKVSKEQARPSHRSMQWINNLQQSSAYITKLYEEMSNLVQRNRAFDEQEITKIMAVAFEMKATADTFSHHLQSYLHKILAIVEAQMRARGLAEFEQLDYRINEGQFINNEINDPWVLTALQAWDQILDPYRSGLNEMNFEELIKEVVSYVTHQMETITFQKAFTQYGGLQVDKDLRALRNYFTEKTEKPVRDKFTRMSQITNLLSVDKVSEVYDLWGGSGGSGGGSNHLMWRVSSAEVKQVLALRVDFEKTAINALKLK